MGTASRCQEAKIDEMGLANRSRHRHNCRVLRRICLFNGTIMPLERGVDADDAQRVANSMVVRAIFGSHEVTTLSKLHPLRPPPVASVAAQLFERHKQLGLSRCIPLFWLPVWAFSFADSFISSLVPIEELQSARLIDEHVRNAPHTSILRPAVCVQCAAQSAACWCRCCCGQTSGHGRAQRIQSIA